MGSINKKVLETEFRRIFSVLMNGSPKEYKGAKNELEKLWRKDPKMFRKSAPVALEYLERFDEITTSANKAAFASGLGLFFLTLADEHFEALKDFVLRVIQHPDGHIREAIRNAAIWLHISLSSRLAPFVYPHGTPLTPRQEAEQKEARRQHRGYLQDLESLIDRSDDGTENAKYVNEMKPSVAKSTEMLLDDVPSGWRYALVDDVPEEILAKRKEIEMKLLQLLEKTNSTIELDDVKEMVYNEEEAGDRMKIATALRCGGISELENILALLNDAWNYFPHKVLGGRSPMEQLHGWRGQDVGEGTSE